MSLMDLGSDPHSTSEQHFQDVWSPHEVLEPFNMILALARLPSARIGLR
jgi:hypothetical protein